jgi:hypothetical protein
MSLHTTPHSVEGNNSFKRDLEPYDQPPFPSIWLFLPRVDSHWASVVVDYHPSNLSKNPESISVHDMKEADGTTEGPCPFIVHGLTGEEISTKIMEIIKAIVCFDI